MPDIKLLDCTLRDGGYVNNWKWGFERAKSIIRYLVQANVDVVEVGFLRDVDEYNPNITVCNHIEELNKLLPSNCGNSMFSAMAMRSNYDINKLTPYNGTGIEMIRITAHDYDIKEGLEFAKVVKEKGYKVSFNPINIMGYTDAQILWIIEKVNEIEPYQFSIVDTFGSMKKKDLDRIVSLIEHNLKPNIRVALHLHENMSLSFSLAQQFADKHLNRDIAIDGSLMGMGRIPGNLPIELIADYLNDNYDCKYDVNYMLDAIQDYIAPIKGESQWGYTPAYFLSARYNLHRNYAEYYLKKGDLTTRDINYLLSQFDSSKATVFDSKYADKIYENYKNNNPIDDCEARNNLMNEFFGRNILIMAPGSSILQQKEMIEQYIRENNPIVISINFVPEKFKTDYAFISNRKRLEILDNPDCKMITTSNINCKNSDYVLDYNKLIYDNNLECNSLIMFLNFLSTIGVNNVSIAGADGYSMDERNYYNTNIRNYTEHGEEFNQKIGDIITNLKTNVTFLTPSFYERKKI